MRSTALILSGLLAACGPARREEMQAPPAALPELFGRTVAERVELLLEAQGSSLKPDMALQAVLPYTFCYLGLDPDGRMKGDPRLRDAIRSLGRFLCSTLDDKGGIWDGRPDPRSTYAWADAMIRLRSAGKESEFDFPAWSDKIERACRTLIEMRLNHLVGVRRFVGRTMATGANHVAYYLVALFRAGQALGKQDLIDFALPIARAFAADIHPDGYWEEHGDLLRTGGPTTSYTWLTHTCISLLAAWTGETVFQEAVFRSTRFLLNFAYPDGIPFDLIDERVRYKKQPHVRGFFGLSRTAEGRGAARFLMERWLAMNPPGKLVEPDVLVRLCENQLYWLAGDEAVPAFARPDHRAQLTLPGGLFRRGEWTIGLSTMRATQAEDPAYRDMAFALDREKLFSVFHSKAGLILDGSHSKGHPMNATFAVTAYNWKKDPKSIDYLPCGGTIGEENGAFTATADYRSFRGIVRIRVLSKDRLEIVLEADLAATRGPATAGFTFLPKGDPAFGPDPWERSTARFAYGSMVIEGPETMKVRWPFAPFNPYSKDHQWAPEYNVGRVEALLTPDQPRATFVLTVVPLTEPP